MLKYKLDTLDGLSDALKELYEERDGAFYLKVEGAEDVSGLKNKNSELLGKLQREKEQREQLERERREAEEARMREKGEYESLYKAEREKFQALNERYENERAERINQTREQFASKLAVDLSGKLGEKAVSAIKRFILDNVKTSEEGPYFELAGFKVDYETMRQKMANEYPFLVAGSQASGGQATGSGGEAVAGVKNPWKKDSFNLTEQARLLRDDPQTAERLKAQAQT